MDEELLGEQGDYFTEILFKLSSFYIAAYEAITSPVILDGRLYDSVKKDIEIVKFRIEHDPVSTYLHMKFFRTAINGNYDEEES